MHVCHDNKSALCILIISNIVTSTMCSEYFQYITCVWRCGMEREGRGGGVGWLSTSDCVCIIVYVVYLVTVVCSGMGLTQACMTELEGNLEAGLKNDLVRLGGSLKQG